MRRTLTGDEFNQLIFGAAGYAWRWEQQPTYWVGRERERVQAFLAGRRDPAPDNPSAARYLRAVRAMTDSGRRIGRVRVVDRPPTGYQQWLRWMDRWATEAGEVIHYLSRPTLQQWGRPPVEPEHDWWLIDGEKLIVMRFDDAGRLREAQLVLDEPEIQLARLWRLAVISWAVEEERAATAAAA